MKPAFLDITHPNLTKGFSFSFEDLYTRNRQSSSYKKLIYVIYKITNIKSGKCYVGQTVNLRTRLHQHKSEPVTKMTDPRRLGNPKFWKVDVLELVHIKNVANSKKPNSKVTRLENIHISKALKEHGNKCLNKRVSDYYMDILGEL